MTIPILGLYAGRVAAMPGDGRPTAIFKQPVTGAVRIGLRGMECDVQADRRYHGGAEKALHHFPLETHHQLASRFPEQATQFVGGGIGENISTEGVTEASACIGDVYAVGTARVQLAQPRTPCWKIDAKFGRDGISAFIGQQNCAGWYYRVLAPGVATAGDAFTLLERADHPLTLAEFWKLTKAHRPAPEALRRAAEATGLAAEWRRKLLERALWLERRGHR